MPLRHERAVIAAPVLTARLRTARRTGRPLYGPAAHPPTAPAEQLLLFAQEQQLTAGRPAVEVEVLRTDLEALGLTAEQLGYLSFAGQHLSKLRKDANRRAPYAASGSAPDAQKAAEVHRQDDQRAHQTHQPGPGQSPGALR